jgi:cytochrome c-type biogenesis protein CcsB
MGIILFELALTGYFLAAALGVIDLVRSRSESARLAVWLMAAGFVLHTAAIAFRYFTGGHLPISSMHEAASFFAWLISLIFFIIILKFRIRVFVSFVVPIVFLIMFFAAFMPRAAATPGPALQSPWPWLHAICAFAGLAAFAVAAGAGVMYLAQHYALKTKHLVGLSRGLPNLQVIDDINHKLSNLGFALFTIAIAAGALWAENILDKVWHRDPKALSAFMTWLVYAVCFMLRRFSGWKQKRAAILSIIGFAAALFTFFGVNLLLNTFHSFK